MYPYTNYKAENGARTQSSHDLIKPSPLYLPGKTFFANVYGPQSLSEKNKLWDELADIKRQNPGTWLFFGDFNAVRRPEERFDSEFCSATASSFNSFIEEAGLHEYNMGGLRYIYFRQFGTKLSKLDRFLVCSKFLNQFPSAAVTAHPRELSDHSPVTLCCSTLDFGPVPFRFFNSWMMRDNFDSVVTQAWGSFIGYDGHDSYLSAKLKYLKGCLRKWRKEEFRLENIELSKAKATVKDIDAAAEIRPLSEKEIFDRRIGFQKIAVLEKNYSLDLKQKARIKWTIDGDENSKFFHGYVNNKNRRCRLHRLMIDGSWKTNPLEIKEEVFNLK